MLFSRNFRLVVAVAVTLGLGGQLRAGEKPAPAGDAATIQSKISENKHPSCFGACRINFPKELGLSLAYLEDIGHRIHKARRGPDPVELALAAQALSVAETIAGKTASITSAQVLGEAVELAQLRGVSEELFAVSMIVTDAAAKKELAAMADSAKSAEAEARESTENGEASKELVGTLRVINRTNECLNIFVDGMYLGEVHAGTVRAFQVHAHNWHNHFDAYCVQGGELVRHADFVGHSHFLNWEVFSF